MLFLSALRTELIFLKRSPMRYCMPTLFFMVVCALFPFFIADNQHVLSQLSIGIMWIAILLAQLLSLPYLFQEAYDDGSLDQWLIQPNSLATIALVKVATHWIFFILPMILLVPFLAILYNLPVFIVQKLMLSLMLGTPVMIVQASIVASVCVSLRRAGLLLAIILLPLYIPIIIFGVSFQFYLLSAWLILSLTFGSSVVAYALRIGITYG